MKPNETHLEFLQNNINRMNQCSFQMKGWAITVVSALIALYASSITEANSGNWFLRNIVRKLTRC